MWHGFGVVDGGNGGGVVDGGNGGGVVDGGCSQKEVMWQRVSHSYHIWDAMDCGLHQWGYISLRFCI